MDGWDWVGGNFLLSTFFSCTFCIFSLANLLPIQKINKYFFGSKRIKKRIRKRKAPLVAMWIIDFRCGWEMGGVWGPLGGIFSSTLH